MESKKNMLRAISENGGVVFCGLDSTDMVRRMEQLHKTSAVCSAALGRLITAASMMGIMLKSEKDTVTLRVKGDGPAGLLLAVSNGTGSVKGYMENPRVDLPSRPDGKLDVGGAVGHAGTLSVVRDLGLKEPYVGMVPLVSGEIAEDVTSYYAVSEQIPTVCALGVLVNPDLTIRCAGGFLLQLLPGANEEEISRLEKNISAMPSVTQMMEKGEGPRQMMELAMAGFEPQVLDEYRVDYHCDCSQERTERAILSLGKKELEELCKEEPTAEVVCQFCNKKYQVDLAELMKKV